MNPPDVSLVVPVRNEAGNIGPLVAEIRTALDAAGLRWEVWIVDDGSTDGSWDEIAAVVAAEPRVEGIRQGRGLGKSAALAAGFARCRGDRIVMLDGDGQDDPAEIPRLLAGIDAGHDLVNGWKHPRLDPWDKTLPSRVFNLLVGEVTGLRLHDHNCGLKAMRAAVARGLPLHEPDMHRFIPVLAAAAGHRVTEAAVHHRPRVRGQSKYGARRFFTGLVDLMRVSGRVRGRGRLAAPLPAGMSRARARRSVAWILAAMAIGGALGRIGAVSSVDRWALEKRLVTDAVAKAKADGAPADPTAIRRRIEQEKRVIRPFLSANDRSRWLTVRALVEQGTFAIDGLVGEPGWDTIDAVAHHDAAGRLRLYSSKPPLLAVLAAGPYWVLHRLTGWTLGDHPFEMGRMLLVPAALLPLIVSMLFTFRLVDRIGASDWGRFWTFALVACGTLLSTFVVAFTNHLPAAACTAVSGWLVQRIRGDGLRSAGGFFTAGLAAALAAAFELPALAWAAAVLGILAITDLRRTITWAAPAALLVAVAALGANHAAHGTPWPAYSHRGTAPAEAGGPDANWYDYSLTLPTGKVLTSYWRNPQGVDRGEPSAAAYAVHMLVGHHGIFSLTPAWLLVVPGLVLLASPHRHPRPATLLALAILGVSVVVIGFYLARPRLDRNYGGVVCCFRWALWLVPLWAAAVTPAADRLSASRTGRGIALLLLALSVISVSHPTWNPWAPPWLQQWLFHGAWLPES